MKTGPKYLLFLSNIDSAMEIENIKKESDDQTNIEKYRVAAYITEYHIILKLFFLKPSFQVHDDKAIISCIKCM